MMRRTLLSLAFSLGLVGTAAAADCWSNVAGSQANCGAVQMYLDINGKSIPTTDAAGLPVRIISGGTGGGAMTVADGADVAEGATTDAAATAGGAGTVSAKLRFLTSVAFATSTNQTSQLTQETAINTILGLQADAACGTDNGTCGIAALIKRLNQRLTTINTTLGTPFQAGGSIGNTTFASTVADGANVVEGALADAIATQGGTGSLSAKLRLATSQLNTLNTTVALAANQTVTQAPVAPATATATKSDLVGCQATTAAVNPTNGQQGACSSDTNNNILVSAGGAPNLLTGQVSVATSDTSVAAARALRRSITIQQITGTQQVYCSNTTATTANGMLLPAVVGASITLNTTSAVRCIAVTGAQTVAVAETY